MGTRWFRNKETGAEFEIDNEALIARLENNVREFEEFDGPHGQQLGDGGGNTDSGGGTDDTGKSVDDMSYEELQEEAKRLSLAATGKKEELRAAIKAKLAEV